MGLDITFVHRKEICCPKCGEVVTHVNKRYVDSGGRIWYDLLESLGYYVPYDERTEDRSWYGKDMILTSEQARAVYDFLTVNEVYCGDDIKDLIAIATYMNELVVINANW